MGELVKINDDLERIKREYVRMHISTQREYLEHRVRNGNDLARLFCSAAITNLDVSQSALEQAVNGIQIEIIPDEEALATREMIYIQRLMDANSLMTRFTFQIIAQQMLKNIKPDMVLIPPGLEPKKALQYSSALRQKKIPHVYWQFGQDFDGREQKILLDVLADRVGLNTKNTKETYVNTEPNARFPKLNRYFAAYKI